jgi:transcriptional regulator with XRE-family HTH domain
VDYSKIGDMEKGAVNVTLITLTELAKGLEVDYSKIGDMERGAVNVTLITLTELAKGLEVDASELLKFDIE